MAYAALVSLEETTGRVLKPGEYSISVAEKGNIESIREYVMDLISFLEESPDKAIHLEAKIRDLANETEDIIEFYMLKEKRLRRRSVEGSELLQQLVKEAEKIGLIAGEVREERAVGSSSVSTISSSGVATTRQKDVVVGLDGDLTKIKDRLCGVSFNSKLEVLPIVGMGGIGKTTLARYAFDDPLIVDRFTIRAWVTVSQDYREQRILSSLIDSMKLFINELALEQNNDDNATLVYQTLKYRRYLIVLDDVWSTKVWDDLMMIFPDDGNGSRIILTSRESDVAAYPDSQSPFHEMQSMDVDQSCHLLQQKIGSFPSGLEDTGKEIARRCAGLPLAVVLVAGVLSAASKTKASWDEIAKTVNLVVGQELEAILSLSYTHLPHHLRPCLLFIGGFPGDRIIRVSRLTKLWVAEGFLKHSGRYSLEEEAEEYLEDLVKRNLVTVNSWKCDGKIKSCSVHDMVRDMCISKAHNEKFLRVVGDRVLPRGLMNDRRISLCGGVDIDNIWGPTIHTILCFEQFQSWEGCCGRSRLLRVLDAVVLDSSNELPALVFELFHLRYLASFDYLEKIPSAISNLVNLQTLIIHPRTHLEFKIKWAGLSRESDFALRLEIWRMGQLRHLLIYVPHTLPPPPDPDGAELLPLVNLQTISIVRNLEWDEKVLKMIPNVKKLGLVYTSNRQHGLHHLKDMHQLEKLKIRGDDQFCWQGKNPNFPGTLKKLSLVGGGFPWEDIGILGALPNLQFLKLRNNACHGETWEVRYDEFPQLMFLLIDNSSLRRWIAQTNSFPRLKFLLLRLCWKLSEIPEDIGDISTLELIEVGDCNKSLVKFAQKIIEDQERSGNDSLQVRIVGEFTDSSSAVSSSGVVGLHDDLLNIKERLCGGPSNTKLKVLPIVGVDGIGKTTLALNAFDDPLIVNQFPIRAWVTESHSYRKQEILSSLRDSLRLFIPELALKQKKDDLVYTTLEEVFSRPTKYTQKEDDLVYTTLKGRRYLIVLDDVRRTEDWDDLRKIFPDDGKGSRIMLTTTQSNVATYAGSHSPIHEMRFMDNQQSWNLLQQKVGSFPSDLIEVGKKIARRCAGLPLAVFLVAGVLSAVSKTRASWEEIAEAVNPAEQLEEILLLSYTHLPHHLRPCLLFFGGFQGDGIIRVSRLTKLWVAAGFLKHRDGCSLEEEAEEYLEDLVKRNLVTVNSRKCDGKIKSCSVHHMVRGWCSRNARYENFLGVVDDVPTIPSWGGPIIPIWGPTIKGMPYNVGKGYLGQVFELFHLRYLTLSDNVKVIPSVVSNLVNLQTLLRPASTSGILKIGIKSESDFSLPLEIWRMGQLRHLLMYVPHTLPSPPDQDGAELLPLENLQTLLLIQNLAWDKKVLQMIPNLKRLGLVYTGYQEYGLHNLKDLNQLEKLEIYGHHHFRWQGRNPNFPWTLKKLSLVGGGFPWEEMGIVGSLPNLQVLKLWDNACHGETWEVRDDEFPQLMSLLIETSSLRRWITANNSFPGLKFLVLRSCCDLSEIPEEIGDISTLELIEVHQCSLSLVTSAKKIKEDQERSGNDSLQVRISQGKSSRKNLWKRMGVWCGIMTMS